MSHHDAPQSRKPEPLPFATVVWLWERLALRYGQLWLGRWAGMNTTAVQEEWRYELAGITDHQLQHAIDNAPHGRTPDLGEFRRLCREAPQPRGVLALEPPTPKAGVPAQIRSEIAKALTHKAKTGEPHRVTVARNFLKRWEHAEKLTPLQRQWIVHSKRVLERHERRLTQEQDFEAAKLDAQSKANALQEQQHG
ncbi:hypothetical protein [Ramlibacter sp.]|uniref:hypothetical protein n=1 Tax=Ramlibacter sp. TaxID=1917967 RepID=UPI003D0C63C1